MIQLFFIFFTINEITGLEFEKSLDTNVSDIVSCSCTTGEIKLLNETCIAGVLQNETCPESGFQCCAPCDSTCLEINDWFVEHRDKFCRSLGGTCKHDSNTCNGNYNSGMCGGKKWRKCCTPPDVFKISVLSYTVQIILIIMIILTNGLVILRTITDKSLHTVPYVGICCLANADLLLAVFWFIIQSLTFYHGTMIMNVNKQFRHLLDLAFVCEMKIIIQILLITLDRFLAVVYPMVHYKWTQARVLTVKKTIIISACAWSVAALLGYSRRFSGEWVSCHRIIIMSIFRTIVPLCVTAVLNLMIFFTIEYKSGVSHVCKEDISSSKPSESKKIVLSVQNKKAARTVGLILISILLAYVPLRIITMLSICEVYMGLYEKLSDYIVFAKLLNSLINPTLYAISTPTFINSVKKIFIKRRDPVTQNQTRSSNLSKK
ncbi:melanocyte-stimulating hormone receptor [Eurytemora carolleeae]|uniref:melanocyte-stimulating hormone receptor n=1 Tax=Eurytemora carolleeae TaxID=1294199 RepID=UPI000C79489C|nr:melanocyte-stimulating hormone receptor [Eurytemora carolleeae]|eukprot:XP_023321630.1 melanocyte-stimulating hormone receptor-like [Eurytemora affinis]